MAIEDEERETLEDQFLSGDLVVDEIDHDDSIIDDDDEDFKPGPLHKESSFDDDDDDPDEEDEDNEDDDDEDEEKEEVDKSKQDPPAGDSDGNEFYLRAQFWKETGLLAPNVEVKKDLNPLELEELYIAQVKEDTLNAIKTDIRDAIAAKGIDPDEIFGGESPDQYYQKEYTRIAGLTYDNLVENNEDITATIRLIATEYWISKTGENLTEEEVTTLVDKDLDKYSEEELYEKVYRKYFANESKRLEVKIREDAKEKANLEMENTALSLSYVKQQLASGKIGDRKLEPDEIKKVQDALFKKDQVYDNGKGVRRRGITLFEKKRLEAADNIDQQLEMAVNMVLNKKESTIKEKSERVGAINILTKLAKFSSSTPVQESKGKKKSSRVLTGSAEFEEMLIPD